MNIFQNEIAHMIEQSNRNQTAWDYFEGGVPEFFATPELRRAVRGTVSKIGMNHSRTVVTALVNRLEVNNIVGASDKSNKIIKKTIKQNGGGAWFNDLFTKTSVYGQAFAMVWPDANGDWRLSVHTPREMYAVYNKENPWELECVLRVWQETDNKMRMNVFYADKVVKYSADSVGLGIGMQWVQMDTVENPFGEIPIFHFRNDNECGRPEHYDAYSSQDAINKLIITHMYTVDYQGAPQRYALANIEQSGEARDFDEDQSDRSNIEGMQAGPGELWYLKGVQAVGEFGAAPPAIFWDPIKDLVRTMASLTETPLHYFEKTGNIPSGQALRTAEAPLLKKAERRRDIYEVMLENMFGFILRQEGAKPEVTVKWEKVESIDILEEWDLYAKKRNVGMPFRQVLIEAGYAKEEIDQIIEWSLLEQKELESIQTYKRANPTVRVQQQNNENNVDGGNEE